MSAPRTVHVIWHHVRHPSISDAKEVVGVVLTGWQDAQAVVDKLIAEDDEPHWGRNNYWREEVDVLVLATATQGRTYA